jgi:hypothetical protein
MTADLRDGRVRRLALSTAGRQLETRLSGMQRAHLARIFAGSGRQAEIGWRIVMGRMSLASAHGMVRQSDRPTVRRH